MKIVSNKNYFILKPKGMFNPFWGKCTWNQINHVANYLAAFTVLVNEPVVRILKIQTPLPDQV